MADYTTPVHKSLNIELNKLSTEVIPLLSTFVGSSDRGITADVPHRDNQNVEYLVSKIEEITGLCLDRLEDSYSMACKQISVWNTLPPLVNSSTAYPTQEHSVAPALHRRDYIGRRRRQEFTYSPLPHPDSIRLVKIVSIYPRVRCEIEVTRLSELPLYKAVSYCWGSPEFRVSIVCNDSSFGVTPNLWGGMRRLYQYSKTTSTELFWIDQVCIDQSNMAERTSQVRLMKTIYQQSERTIIWLPIDDGTASYASGLVSDLWSLLEKRKQDCTTRTIITATDSAYDDQLPRYNVVKWNALKRLLDSPWFERCWIIQEVTLSKRSPRMLCGRQVMSWSHFAAVIYWLRYHECPLYMWRRALFVTRINAIGGKDFVSRSDRAPQDLQALFYLTRSVRATDPRDRIFALLGLAQETNSSDQWPVELIPDYGKPVSELYVEVARYCLRRSGSLSILQYFHENTGYEQETHGKQWPSWVPRWDNSVEARISIGTSSRLRIPGGWRKLKEPIFNASNGHPIVIDDKTPPSTLRLLGVSISSATNCLPIVLSDEVFEDANRALVSTEHLPRLLLEMLGTCGQCLPKLSTSELHTAFLMTTTASAAEDWSETSHEPLQHFRAFLRMALARPYKPRDAQPCVQTALRATLNISTLMPLVTLHLDCPKGPDPLHYTKKLVRMASRRLFITKRGQLGLGPPSMAPGDQVVVLFGGELPFVIRPLENGTWHFIGECYIYGIMRGEALQGDGADERNHEWFELV